MTKDKCHIWGYVRASTMEQKESLTVQKDAILGYVSKLGIGEVDAIFTDAGVSGSVRLIERPFGKILMAKLSRGDHVVFSKLDRGFRNVADFANSAEQFERLGVKLHLCNFPGGAMDFSSPTGKLVAHMMAAFAEFERSMISDRTKEATASRRKRGLCLGREAPLGFKLAADPRNKGMLTVRGTKVLSVVPDPEERAKFSWLIDRQDEGLTLHKIAVLANHHKITTRGGGRMTFMNVHQYMAAEKKLRAKEARERANRGEDQDGSFDLADEERGGP